jgi:hypothetical protein
MSSSIEKLEERIEKLEEELQMHSNSNTLVNYVDEAIADVGLRVDRITEAVQMQFTLEKEGANSTNQLVVVALLSAFAGAAFATAYRK